MADVGEIIASICDALKTRRICSRCYSKSVTLLFVDKHQTRLCVFQQETSFSQNFVFDWEICFRLCDAYRFQNLEGLELPIKHTLSRTESVAYPRGGMGGPDPPTF